MTTPEVYPDGTIEFERVHEFPEGTIEVSVFYEPHSKEITWITTFKKGFGIQWAGREVRSEYSRVTCKGPASRFLFWRIRSNIFRWGFTRKEWGQVASSIMQLVMNLKAFRKNFR